MITRRGLLQTLAGGAAAVAGLAGYAFAEPVLGVRTARYELEPPQWTRGLTLRIVALADVHACEPWMSATRIAAICDRANDLGGDVIVLLGDYTSGMARFADRVRPQDWSQALSRLRAPLGVHAIMGNHDWWDDLDAQDRGGGETVGHKALRDVGIPVYSNQSRRLEKGGQAFWLAGLEDQLALRPGKRWGRTRMSGLDDLPLTLAQVTDDAPVILLAHEPDIFPTVPSRVSLTLSGHTHGGQVRVFGYSPIVPSRYGTRYAYGHVTEAGRDIVISGGLGCSIVPVRFGLPPEITVIDLA